MPILEKAASGAVPAASAAQSPDAVTRTSRRHSLNPYEQVLTKAALLLALVIVVGVWWVGGYATIAWLAGVGVPLAALGLAAWALPIAVTVLEAGTLAARSRLSWLWLVWAAVLLFDVVTTAVGLLAVAEGRVVFGHTFAAANPTSWVIACVFGAVIALVPEPAVRAIWRELWS